MIYFEYFSSMPLWLLLNDNFIMSTAFRLKKNKIEGTGGSAQF